jgi:hypothetical protein
MNSKEYTDLLNKSREYLHGQQEIITKQYGLIDYERMDYEQDTGKMIFTVKDGRKVIMSFQVVGSISDRSNTWMWSWDNPYLLENVAEEMFKVKAYGEKNGVEKLVTARWPGNDDDGWEMTAIATWVLKAKGAFSFLSDEMLVFVVFTDIVWSEVEGKPIEKS